MAISGQLQILIANISGTNRDRRLSKIGNPKSTASSTTAHVRQKLRWILVQ